jgi:metal-responsive CopG/Arc/MetJ family transcriptional regulator
MRTVQMTLDEKLVADVDKAAKRLKTSRSAFTRDALRDALGKLRTKDLERQHRDGYTRKPVRRGEFDAWESVQDWGEE